jgi:hypothetical protein
MVTTGKSRRKRVSEMSQNQYLLLNKKKIRTFPIAFSFINHTKDAQYLNWTNVTGLDNAGSNFDNIQGVVVSPCTGIWMDMGRVFPRLRKATIIKVNVSFFELQGYFKTK